MNKIYTPWTEGQVQSLNAFQQTQKLHPFTGPNREILIATKDGWVIYENGPVRQNWAWDIMTNWEWKKL
jgi:hypothetical protein